MPKLIPKVKEHILVAAKQLLFQKGYAGLVLRELAEQCNIAVGTIYNYFPNKEMLVASIMAEDWLEVLNSMQKRCGNAATIEQGIRAIYDEIGTFTQKYEPIWSEYSGVPSSFGQRHIMLRTQLTNILNSLLERLGHEKATFLCPLLAETVLACAMQKDIGYPALCETVNRMFPE